MDEITAFRAFLAELYSARMVEVLSDVQVIEATGRIEVAYVAMCDKLDRSVQWWPVAQPAS